MCQMIVTNIPNTFAVCKRIDCHRAGPAKGKIVIGAARHVLFGSHLQRYHAFHANQQQDHEDLQEEIEESGPADLLVE